MKPEYLFNHIQSIYLSIYYCPTGQRPHFTGVGHTKKSYSRSLKGQGFTGSFDL